MRKILHGAALATLLALLGCLFLGSIALPVYAGGLVHQGSPGLEAAFKALGVKFGLLNANGTPVVGDAAGDITAVLVGTGLAVDTDTGDVTITLDEELVDVAGVTPTADQFLGGTGSALAMRTPAQVRTSIGLSVVEAVTAGSGGPNVLAATEEGKVVSNEGVTAQAYNTLPAAAAGLVFTFVLQDADGIRVVANTGDTIRVLSLVSPAAGYVESTTIGSAITLVALNATEWVAISAVGTWTVSS